MPTPDLPPGYQTRPATLEDSQAVYELMAAVVKTYQDGTDESLEDVQNDLKSPHANNESNTRVILNPEGTPIGYGSVYDSGRPQAPFIDLYIHPNEPHHTHLFDWLFEWAESRVKENLLTVPAEQRVALFGYSGSADAVYKTSLERGGMSLIRHSYEMAIEMQEPPVAVPLPEGFTLRFATRDEDWRPILEAMRDAWRDHWGYVEAPFEEHHARWTDFWNANFQEGLWLIGMDGDRVAGLSLCTPTSGDDENCGYVGTLAVRRDYRRRGLAMALLKNSFVALYQIGKREATLGVDASSLTGATRLYEAAGMHVKKCYDLYEKELRPGIDTRVTSV
jgi:ribosomal protein S18 acetylase RimI-like enzyme